MNWSTRTSAIADQGLAVDAVLQPAEGRRRGEGHILLGRLAGGELEDGVVAEGLVVVEVLVAQGDGDDPLGEHGPLVVDDEDGVAGVGDGGVEGVEQSECGRRPRGAAGPRRRW